MHDETVDRTTSGTGEVGRMTLAEVRSLDAGSHAGPRFAGEPVPTYPETLEALRGSGATLILDIKQEAMLDNERVVRLAVQHGEDPCVIIAARSITDLLDFRRLTSSLRSLGLVPGPESGPPDPAAIEEFAQAGAGIIRLWPQWILDSGPDAPPEQSPLVHGPRWLSRDINLARSQPEKSRTRGRPGALDCQWAVIVFEY
jgi:glycerophosphoryl diester phosphodiesterase